MPVMTGSTPLTLHAAMLVHAMLACDAKPCISLH